MAGYVQLSSHLYCCKVMLMTKHDVRVCPLSFPAFLFISLPFSWPRVIRKDCTSSDAYGYAQRDCILDELLTK